MFSRASLNLQGTTAGTLVVVVMLAGAVAATQGGCAADQGPVGKTAASAEVIDRAVASVYPALVRIAVVITTPSDGRMRKLQASGSGAIISPEGYVITNHHVAGKAERIICRLADRQEIDAVLVGSDPMTDIAILKLKLEQRKDKDKPLPVAKFGDSDKLRIGQTVLAMGSPAGLSQSVTVGVVSNTEMVLPYGGLDMEGEPVGMLVRWIGHDASIYHGNSGGPLVNLDGEIVGINELGVANIGGAIPSNLASKVAAELIANHGKVTRSWTGLECQAMLKNSPGPRGVLVGGVIADSPADKAGVKPGDLIVEFAGRKVQATVAEEMPLFNQLVLSQPVVAKVKLTVLRAGQTKELELTTVAREKAIGNDGELKAWGITGRDFTMLSSLEAERAGREGVKVETVRPGGPCSEAKPAIHAGDVIVEVAGQKVRNLEDLRRITAEVTKDSQGRKDTLVAFERGVRQWLTVVKIGKEPDKSEPTSARKAWMGVSTQVLTADLAKALNLTGKTGVRITQVLAGTNAAKADLKVGDVILKFDGDVINARQAEDEEVFPNMVRRHAYNSEAPPEVPLEIVRNGKVMTVPVTLQLPPTPASELKSCQDEDFEFTAREMSFLDRTDRKLSQQVRGVLIERVENAGWAALAGLAPGDVLLSIDGKETADVKSLQSILQAARKEKSARMVFQIKRGIHTRYLELEPDWR